MYLKRYKLVIITRRNPMADLISIPFSWDDLCDIIHYAEWKVEEVDEAGCDLEHPNIREVLKRLKYIQSRMRYSSTEEAQRIIDQEQRE
jgi:hypothetical protein